MTLDQTPSATKPVLSRRFSVAPMMDWKCFYIFLFKFKQIDKGAN